MTKKLILLLFTLNLPFLFYAQSIKSLQSTLSIAQTNSAKEKILLEIADYHLSQNDNDAALLSCAKAIKIQKISTVAELENSKIPDFLETRIIINSDLEQLKSMLKKLDTQYLSVELISIICLATAFDSEAHLEHALKLAEEALAMSRAEKNTQSEASVYYYLGRIHSVLKKNKEATSYFNRYLEISRELKNTVEVVYALDGLRSVEKGQYNFEAAVNYASEAVELAYLAKNIPVLRMSVGSLADLIVERGGFEGADSLYQELISWVALEGDKLELLNAKRDYGVFLRELGYYKKATDVVRPVVEEFVKDSTYNEWSDAFRLFGVCHFGSHNYDSATYYFQESIYAAIKYDGNSHTNLLRSVMRLTVLQTDMGFINRDTSGVQQIYDYFEAMGLKEETEELWTNRNWQGFISSYHSQSGQKPLDTLIQKTLVRLKKRQETYNPAGIFKETFYLNNYFTQKKDYQSAIKYVEDALQLSDKSGFNAHRCRLLLALTNNYIQLKNYSKAIGYAEEGVLLSEKIGFKNLLKKYYTPLAAAYVGLGNYEKAFNYQAQLNKLDQELDGQKQRTRIDLYEARFKVRERKLENEQLILEKELKDHTIEQRTLLIAVLVGLIFFLFLVFYLYNERTKFQSQDKLRKELTRDIHDEVGGILNNLKINVKEVLEEIPPEAKVREQLTQTLVLGNYAVNSLENLIWNMDGEDKSLERFEQGIQDFTKYYFSVNNIPYDLKTEGFCVLKQLPFFSHHNLFMIYKEALQNILKHGDGNEISMELIYDNESIEMKVSNHFGESDVTNSVKGRGLNNMKTRADLIKADINFKQDNSTFELDLYLKLN